MTKRPTRSMDLKVVGVFDYVPTDGGWSDSFRVVDEDGAPFDLRRLMQFHGQSVIMLIREVHPRGSDV